MKKTREEIEDEAVEVHNVVIEAVNQYYKDKKANIACIYGVLVAIKSITEEFNFDVVDYSLKAALQYTDERLNLFLNTQDEED